MQILRSVRVFYKDRLAAWLLNFSVLFILATWGLLLFNKIVKSPLAVLHINIYSGIDVLGHWKWLYIIPAIFLGVAITDILLAVLLWTRQRVFSYFLLATILVSNLILFLYFLYLFNILKYNI